MFCFIHAADIHLDSPLHDLERYEGAPVEEIRSATRRAFDKLIQLAIAEKVEFVLLVGDLYDGDWKDYNTGLYFLERMGRLREVGIQVFIVAGNHDAASQITKHLRLPNNVTLFLNQETGESYPVHTLTLGSLRGGRVYVEGMSSGTRDHLYLALRLASIDKYMDSVEPMPFIVEDVLVDFDDDRSQAALNVLVKFAEKTQVILFTHHLQIVEQPIQLSGLVQLQKL